MWQRQVWNGFVAANIEGADRQGTTLQRVGDLLILFELLGLIWRSDAIEEEELGPQQTGAFGAIAHGSVGLSLRADVREYLNSNSVSRSTLPLCSVLLGSAPGALL